MTPFLVTLVRSGVGSPFKIFMMYWYKCMTPFSYHLHLVINKYLCPFCDSFPGIDYKSNEEPLSGISKYIIFSLTMMFVRFGNYFCCYNDTCNLNEFLYLITFNR